MMLFGCKLVCCRSILCSAVLFPHQHAMMMMMMIPWIKQLRAPNPHCQADLTHQHPVHPTPAIHHHQHSISPHTIPTFSTTNLPTSPFHPTIIHTLKNSNLSSKYFTNSALLPTNSPPVRPNNCHHASSDQISFPAAIQPVSSTSVPTRRGLIRRGISVCSHSLQVAVGALAKRGTPQGHSAQRSFERWWRETMFRVRIVRLR